MSLGEIVLLLIVGIIVVGPRNLPTLMRTAGQWVARLRRLTTDLRSQSGIDDILRKEGLDEHIHQLRSLSRMNVVESLIAPAAAASSAASSPYPPPTGKTLDRAEPKPEWMPVEPLREREYPLVGCDSYGALPDDVMSYRMMAAIAKQSEAAAPEAAAEHTGAASTEAVAEATSEPSNEAPADAAAEPSTPAIEGAIDTAAKPDPTSTEQPKATETATT